MSTSLVLLGKGTYGDVFFDHSRGLALKRVRHTLSSDEGVSVTVMREVRILSILQHPRIMRMFDARVGEKHMFIHIEYLPFSLRNIMDRGFLCTRAVGRITADLFTAIAFCHAQGVIHRDIKPDNLMLCFSGRVKLADFGLAREVLGTMKDNDTVPYTPQMITLWYRAPEVLEGKCYNTLVDVWSAGCVVGEMHLGRPLFPGDSEIGMIKLISQSKEVFCDIFEDNEIHDVVDACLHPCAARVEATEILAMPFVHSGLMQLQLCKG